MKTILLLSLMLHFFLHKVIAQDSISSSQAAATTTFVSLTPEMSSSSVSSYFSSLATSAPEQPGNGPSAGDVGSSAGTSAGDSNAGAAGPDSGSITLSKGGIIAIIVCVVFVIIFGSESSFQQSLVRETLIDLTQLPPRYFTISQRSGHGKFELAFAGRQREWLQR